MGQIAQLVDGLSGGAQAMYGMLLSRWMVSLPALFLPGILAYFFWSVVIGSENALLRTIQTTVILYAIGLSAAIFYLK